MKSNLKYYENLDGLRGIAALMVLVFHFFGYSVSDYIPNVGFPYRKTAEFGQHGVSLFFVLSGFVITRILLKNKGENNYFRNFYWRRALRIFPLYYGFLLFWYYLKPFILAEPMKPFIVQVPFYLYLQNFEWLTGFLQAGPAHFWTLAVEEHFYLFWPLIVFLVPTKHLKPLIFVLILLIIPLKFYFISKGISVNKTTFTRIDQIMLGALLAIFEFNGSLFGRKEYFEKVFKWTLISILPLSVFVYITSKYIPDVKEVFKYNLLGLIFYALIGLLIIRPDFKINIFLKSNILQYLGKISYGIYVWHLFVLLFFGKYFSFKIIFLDLLMCIVTTIIIAHISFYYYEKKFLMFK
jgi:peptidoglycan/LPS O-acetylase OafA/YrhL